MFSAWTRFTGSVVWGLLGGVEDSELLSGDMAPGAWELLALSSSGTEVGLLALLRAGSSCGLELRWCRGMSLDVGTGRPVVQREQCCVLMCDDRRTLQTMTHSH